MRKCQVDLVKARLFFQGTLHETKHLTFGGFDQCFKLKSCHGTGGSASVGEDRPHRQAGAGGLEWTSPVRVCLEGAVFWLSLKEDQRENHTFEGVKFKGTPKGPLKGQLQKHFGGLTIWTHTHRRAPKSQRRT